jgi:hypothetical protein
LKMALVWILWNLFRRWNSASRKLRSLELWLIMMNSWLLILLLSM